MPEVRLVQVAPQWFAGVRRVVRPAEIPQQLLAGLDLVWPVIRARGLGGRGHNVAVYRDLGDGTVEMECGVEVAAPFAPKGEVQLTQTPAGLAAVATHVESVARLAETYRLISGWLEERGTPPLGVAWEIYGHADENGAFDVDVFVLVSAEGA